MLIVWFLLLQRCQQSIDSASVRGVLWSMSVSTCIEQTPEHNTVGSINQLRRHRPINHPRNTTTDQHACKQPLFFCWTAQRDSQQLRVCWVGQAQRWNPPALPPQGLSWFIQFVATVDCTNANFMGQATFLPFGAVPKNVCSAVVAVQIKKHAFRLFREPSLVSMAPWPHSRHSTDGRSSTCIELATTSTLSLIHI